MLQFCERHDLAFLPRAPLGGRERAQRLDEHAPMFAAAAAVRGVSVQGLALAWLLGRSESIILIAGSSEPETIRDFVEAARLERDPSEWTASLQPFCPSTGLTRKGQQHVRIDRLPHEHVASAGLHVFFGDIRHRISSRHGGGPAWLTSRSKPSASR